VGPLLLAVLAALVAGFHSGPTSALVVLIFLGVLRIVQDYIVYPRLIGHGIHLHPLAIIMAILCGAELAGVAGIFLAIPVVAVLTVSYRHWMEHRGSEGFADLLETDLSTAASNQVTFEPTSMSPLPTSEPHSLHGDASVVSTITHPTSRTTPDEMAHARPDLTTGELKLKAQD
jgi:hypothetical protein